MNEEETVILHFKQWILETLGDAHSKEIPLEWAEVIYHKLQNKSLACIQWTDEYDIKLKRPILWQYKAWCNATERWEAEKRRSKRRMIEYDCLQRNIVLLADHIQMMSKLDDERCKQLASLWISKNQVAKIMAVEVELEKPKYES